jgi:mono/diheme cytochrome c family protein
METHTRLPLKSLTRAVQRSAFVLETLSTEAHGSFGASGFSQFSATSAAAAEASGEAVFIENCGGCHTLAAAGTNGTVGPNLDQLMPGIARVEEQVRNGGGRMPAFEGKLSDAQITAVVEYVSSNAGG